MNLRNGLIGLSLTLCVAGPAQAATTPKATPTPATCGPFGLPLTGYGTVSAGPKIACKGGKVVGGFTDSQNIARDACLWEPPQASSSNPLPLVVFLHGLNQTADSVQELTNVLSFQTTANVSNNPAKLGFIVLAPQANLPKSSLPFGPVGALNVGLLNGLAGWNTYYRQYSPDGAVTIAGTDYPENPDAATFDHFITQEVATGKVDPNRIYLMGWSDGGATTYLYGLNRPGIAAAAVYAGPSPFQLVLEYDPCPQEPVDHAPADNSEIQLANPDLPIWQVKNSCDWVTICKNEEILTQQLTELGTPIEDFFIEDNQSQFTGCEIECDDGLSSDGSAINGRGYKNHTRWPTSWTAQMLDFFRQNPLSSGS